MLAAINTTILPRRSWAETCSAMVSRSRLNRTRGPPHALRISSNPLPRGQSTGRPRAGVQLKTQQFYSFGDAANSRLTESHRQNSGTVHNRAHLQAVYRIEPCFAKQKACQRGSSKIRTQLLTWLRQLILQALREIVSSCPDFEVREPEAAMMRASEPPH